MTRHAHPAPRRAAALTAAALAALLAPPLAAHAAGYRAHELFVGEGVRLVPAALNDAGLAVGQTAETQPRAAMRERHQPGLTWSVGGAPWTVASSVASNGLVAGTSGSSQFDLRTPFLRAPDGTTTLPFDGTSLLGVALGVNAAGQVVGMAGDGAVEQRAFSWHAGATTFIPPLAGTHNVAKAVNDAGVVVGWSDTAGGSSRAHAFRWSGGAVTDLGTLPGSQWMASSAEAVNASGYAVGYCQGFALLHACAWDAAGGVHDLGTLTPDTSSSARAVNDLGVAVGSGSPADFSWPWHAVVFHDGVVEDLNVLAALPAGVLLTEAVAINHAGAILAVGTRGRRSVAFWLEPL